MPAISSRRRLALLFLAACAIGSAPATRAALASVTNRANGHAYHVSAAMTTWADAQAWAVSLGGQLVAINDAAEEAWMQASLGLAPGHYWLGARDDINEGLFGWVTGEPFLYQNFLLGEPDDDIGLGGIADHLALSVSPWGWLDTNGDFTGFVTGAIAEVPPPVGIGPAPPGAANASLRAHPSVARDVTRLRFGLARPAVVRCHVVDLAGRSVRELGSATFAAGEHELAWDTRDGEGRSVRGGLYLVRLEADGVTRTCKVIVTR